MNSVNSFPRIIHQTYKTDKLPEKWSNTPKTWINNHLNYQYNLWTDNDITEFIETYFPDHIKLFQSYCYSIQKVDAVRYFWLYKYGGIYVDLDMQSTRSLEPILQFYENNFKDVEVLLTYSANSSSKISTNSIMISKPESPFWKHVIDCLYNTPLKWYHFGKELYVLNTTGPLMLTYALDTYDSSKKHTVEIIPKQWVNPCGHCEQQCDSQYSFVTILQGGSWHDWDSRIFQYLHCVPVYKWIIMVLVLIIGLLILFIIRSKQLNECKTSCVLFKKK